MTTQAIAPFDIALWDMKAKRAKLPLAKLLGAHRDSVQCYNTSGGYLHTPLDQVLKNVAISRESGIGGIKIKVGQPDLPTDIQRVGEVRKLLGDSFPLMVDANQQWDRPKAMRACRAFEDFDLTWIEEPLDAYDFEGHAQLAARFDTAIATGEMLTSFGEHAQLIMADGSDFIQPDAPRVGGITPFLQIMSLASFEGRKLAPHFAMEIHLAWPPPSPKSRGWSILNGSARCSTNSWSCATAACGCRIARPGLYPEPAGAGVDDRDCGIRQAALNRQRVTSRSA